METTLREIRIRTRTGRIISTSFESESKKWKGNKLMLSFNGLENLYHVAGHVGGEVVNQDFDSLADARRYYEYMACGA